MDTCDLLYLLRGLAGGSFLEPEIHYIPQGYLGEVQILMDQEDGLPEEYLGEARLYRVPSSGILKTKFKPNTGWVEKRSDVNYFYVDLDGRVIQKLKNCTWCTKDSINRNDVGTRGATYFGTQFEGVTVSVLKYSLDSLALTFVD